MSRLMCGLVVGVVMVWHTPASAQALRCNPNGTQPELNACAYQRFKAADRELNRVYRQVLKKMKKVIMMDRYPEPLQVLNLEILKTLNLFIKQKKTDRLLWIIIK